jgi:hypothetical protein
MNTSAAFPIWSPFLFIGFWLSILAILSFISGWRSLAATHRADQHLAGKTFYMASASIGAEFFPVNYNNCLTFVVGPSGFWVEPILPFRFLSPRLFMPWSEVSDIKKNSYWFYSSYRVELEGSWVRFSVFGGLGAAMMERWNARS